MLKSLFVAALLVLSSTSAFAQQPAAAAPAMTDAQIEQFLLDAKVVKTRSTSKGITGSIRATLSDGTLTHDAQIQSVDEFRNRFDGAQGPEVNFRDSWMYNIAAYKVDRLLGLNLVPVSVARSHGGRKAAFTWWIDDVVMDEGDRLKKQLAAPDPIKWNHQMWLVRVFDQLIANTDRNLGNLLITKDWRIWAIDHTRAFRLNTAVRVPANLTHCDRKVFERLKALDKGALRDAMGSYVFTNEIPSLLARRDEIVRIIEGKGPAALYDR